MKKAKSVLTKVCQAISDKKGEEVVVLDISGISSFTDYFIICQGYNPKQNQAICDQIRERLKQELRLSPSHVEGYEHAEWILLDYLDFVVHIFSPEARQFYKLERLWSDGIQVTPRAVNA